MADQLIEMTKTSGRLRPGVLKRFAAGIPAVRRALKGHEILEPLVDVAGLGVLAAPHFPSTKDKKGKSRSALAKYLRSPEGVRSTELAGLGMLAVPGAINIINHLRVRAPQAAKTLGRVL